MPSSAPTNKMERSSLAMVRAALLVIGLIAGLSFWQQNRTQEQRLRVQGTGLVRLLANMPYVELTPAGGGSPLRLLQPGDGSGELAYAALVDLGGRSLVEATAPGLFLPNATLPGADAPSAWFGERRLRDEPSGRNLIEFDAPVFDGADLGAFVRVGYFAPDFGPSARELPFIATLALLVFLLVPLFHWLLRREIRPLRQASGEIASLIEEGRLQPVAVHAAGELADFVGHFNRAITLAQQRVHVLEHDQQELETSSKLLSYSKARIERVLEALPEAVFVLDDEGVVTFANGKVSALLGVTREDVIGNPVATWCREPAMLELLQRRVHRGAANAPAEAIELSPQSAPEKVIAVSAYPLFAPRDAGTCLGTLVVVRDNTLESLARRSRGEFVAHLAHELKTPLNVLGMYSEALQGEEADDPQFRNEAVNVIRDEVERLAGLINNLLNITRIENGSLDLKRQRVKMGDLLRDAFENVSRSGRGGDYSFELEVPRELGLVNVDKDLLRIAINNLLTNAIKYNRPGGQVTLGAEEVGDRVRIIVRDTGIGINAQDRARIFDKFFRSEESEVRQRTGHGLGLALVKDIVELHGGSLAVDSEPGVGSEFVIELWRDAGVLQKAV
jgi:two-component system, OmpR family, phosphate regulon sensor histidine kinase PhoR